MKRKSYPIIKYLRKKSDKKLIKLKKQLKFDLAKSQSIFGSENVKNKEAGINIKGSAKKGQKTSLERDIKRNIAKINTILQERGSIEVCKNKPVSKRRKRRLWGRSNNGICKSNL